MGIEPTQPAWKAGTLPLSYTRIERDLAKVSPLFCDKREIRRLMLRRQAGICKGFLRASVHAPLSRKTLTSP